MRIAKYLARCGLGSRRQCETLVTTGQVTWDDRPTLEPSFCVPDYGTVRVGGVAVAPQTTRMFLYNKLPGYIVSRKDPRPTIFDDLRAIDCNLVSVGRLDYLSEGLMILTNNGGLACKWERSEVKRTYEVITRTRNPYFHFLSPLQLAGICYKTPDLLSVEHIGSDIYRVQVALVEGKNREVRNIWRSQGWQIRQLRRTAYDNLTLEMLGQKRWIEITPRSPTPPR